MTRITDPLVPGRLYRAVDVDLLVEMEFPQPQPGLKLHVQASQIKLLKDLQKRLRRALGYKPDLAVVLNAWLATAAATESADTKIAAWITANAPRTD